MDIVLSDITLSVSHEQLKRYRSKLLLASRLDQHPRLNGATLQPSRNYFSINHLKIGSHLNRNGILTVKLHDAVDGALDLENLSSDK